MLMDRLELDVMTAGAIQDVQCHGPRSGIVEAIMWRFAEQLVEDMNRRRPDRMISK
jgi:hypothetical protein